MCNGKFFLISIAVFSFSFNFTRFFELTVIKVKMSFIRIVNSNPLSFRKKKNLKAKE